MKRATTRHNNISTVERRSGLVVPGTEQSNFNLKFNIPGMERWRLFSQVLKYTILHKNNQMLKWDDIRDCADTLHMPHTQIIHQLVRIISGIFFFFAGIKYLLREVEEKVIFIGENMEMLKKHLKRRYLNPVC